MKHYGWKTGGKTGWKKPRFYRQWPVRFVLLCLLLAAGVWGVHWLFLADDNRADGHADDGASVQVEAAELAQQIPSLEWGERGDQGERLEWLSAGAQHAVQSGWAMHDTNLSLRDSVWRFVTGILPENGYFHCLSGIPLLQRNAGRITKIVAEEEAFYASAFISDIWKHQFEKVSDLTLSDQVQVILYHTHNAETYLPDAGVSKVTGQNGGVVQAGQIFQQALQKKYGIRTAHSTTIHDYPDWSRSYQNSLNTAKQLLQAYPDAKAVFDIHRDAGFTSKKTTTATVHGRSAAKIMMVIGCNHDNWQENLAFARLLEEKCNQLYPGLLRDNIRVKETGRYNQQVDGHAVLLEIGSDLNTQAEADYSMECFAHVVYEVLADMES